MYVKEQKGEKEYEKMENMKKETVCLMMNNESGVVFLGLGRSLEEVTEVHPIHRQKT